ncbi:MAG: O-GlcNAc transferase, partial [Armatimonadota bacterium]|nr:O-GlcNAc transferase [Armatimonadota bacterium]
MNKKAAKCRPTVSQDFNKAERKKIVLGIAAIVIMTAFAYIPAVYGGFVWDDDDYVTKNPLLTAPDGLRRIWFTLDSPSQYFPLVYTTFRIEHAIWGLNPMGYHIVNVCLHIINTLLVWFILRWLGIRGSWLAAAIWGLHPVNVESVAWITERKNTLSTLFYL